MSGDALHVLTLTPFYPIEGDDAQGCFIAEPLRYLESFGIKQTVFTVQPFYRNSSRPHPLALPARNEKYFSFPSGFGLSSSGIFLFAKILSQVRQMHEKDHIHLIHAHSALPCGHAAALLSRELKIPFVITVHGLDAYFTNQVKGFAGTWCKRVCQLVYRSAARVVCISEKVRERVLESASAPLRTSIIYNGVDTNLFTPLTAMDESKCILSVGGLIPIKGHEFLIRAFAEISAEFSDYSCEIIGDGPERGYLERLCVELKVGDRVRFSGRKSRAEVAASMRNCSFFCLPSRYEALGCVYLEAMSSGKPVIACREQGIAEVIHDGSNGCLVDPDNSAQIADTLTRLITSDTSRVAIGRAARETIVSSFTLSHQAAGLMQIYEECAR